MSLLRRRRALKPAPKAHDALSPPPPPCTPAPTPERETVGSGAVLLVEEEGPSVAEDLVQQVREKVLGSVSENSRRGYDCDLRMFEEWWDTFGQGGNALGSLLALPGDQASERVSKWLDDSCTSPATQRRRLATMNRFVKIANSSGIVPWHLGVAAPPGRPGVPLHERVVHEIVEEQILTDPGATQVLMENFRAIKRGDYPQWFLDFVVQRPRGELDIYDAYCISSLYKQWVEEEVSVVRIVVGKKPAPDRERERNRRALSALPKPFTASVAPDDRGDGVLLWTEPIQMTLETASRIVSPGSAPIEIGSTDSSRSLLHMLERGRRLARWPYGSEEIILAVSAERCMYGL